MYLKQLYQHNKLWCGIVVFFIVAQLVINYKKSFVVTPFFHYCMFSNPVLHQDSLQIFQVEVNGNLLQPLDFTPQQWDNVILPLNYFYITDKTSDTLWKKFAKAFLKLTISIQLLLTTQYK